MIRIYSKGIISKYFLPYLSRAQRGYISKVPLWEIVNAVLYKFKSGVQWNLLPCKSLIYSNKIKYGAIYHHFRKWIKDGSWQRAWQGILSNEKAILAMSTVQIDGTHSRAVRGGQQVSYQGRKKSKTSNTVWLTDSVGNAIGFLPPLSGHHNDLYRLVEHMDSQMEILKACGIQVEGLFLNADAGFDSREFRDCCFRHGIILNAPLNRRNSSRLEEDIIFDELMYQQRFVIERTNAWMDSYRTMLNRFDTTWKSWNAWHYIASISRWINKIEKV